MVAGKHEEALLRNGVTGVDCQRTGTVRRMQADVGAASIVLEAGPDSADDAVNVVGCVVAAS